MQLEKLKALIVSALEDVKVQPHVCEMTMIPASVVKVTGSPAKQVLDLVGDLEDHDDVQNVYANFDIPDELLDKE